MDQLVVGALQEGRVDRHHGLQALAGEARGEGEGVLFGDPHVVVAVGVFLGEADHAGAFAHGRGDRHQAFVEGSHFGQPVAEDLGVGELAAALGVLARGDAGSVVELGDAVVEDRVGFGELVALALAGDHVQELGALEGAQVLQGGDQGLEVVAVDGADVVEAELLEHRAGHHHALDVLLGAAGELDDRRRQVLEDALAHLAGAVVEAAGEQPREVLVEGPHRRRDGHLVVVEDHQQVGVADVAGVVEGLEGHAGGHRAVADHRDRPAVLAAQAGGLGHAQGGGDGGGRVGGAEGVVAALGALREAGDAAVLAQAGHRLAAAGEHLVGVGLVAHVPDDAVVGGVEDVVQGDREFDRAQVGREVAPRARNGIDQEVAEFVSEGREFAGV